MIIMDRKLIKREKLLDQGVKMLMDQGYHGTGLKDILDSVGIPKGSFYNYFASKEVFAAEAISHYIEPFIIRLDGHLQNPELDGLTALKQYYAELIIEVEQAGYKGGCLLGNLIGELGDTSEVCRRALKETLERYKNLQLSALLRAQQEGTVRVDLNVEIMADLLVDNWQGALLRMKIDQSVKPLQQFVTSLLEDYFLIK
ncbi:MAG: TetR family transcriptional regulator [Gammaproteobacteria bacterium]|nr:TetR family transcriptional regulator [Gammaproteobacteria bacterium]MBT4147084.1 TetR family transcriptional regulator [Gammaproteobacteria bacterium]MBT5221796.1 TetR family transcriptional regulator [Gammaproteobacteria bacterium]MBT5825983.1 TetR family transcriptional regulator [Gammaproteobacteria bacterium]MBT5965687.1 TetR family transcriptional regulator [Gammaproteobacteria bacterium]